MIAAVTPLRLARSAATPTAEELAVRKKRPGFRGPTGSKGITQGELARRLCALGRSSFASEVCRWERPPKNRGAVRPSAATQDLLEKALGLAPGALSRPKCGACGGTGLAAA